MAVVGVREEGYYGIDRDHKEYSNDAMNVSVIVDGKIRGQNHTASVPMA